MNSRTGGATRWYMIALAVVLPAFLSTCNAIVHTESQIAGTARILVTGTSSTPLVLITSMDFEAQRSSETGQVGVTAINGADTASITVPFDKSYAFNGSDRLFIRLANSDQATSAAIRLRLLVDGNVIVDQQATLLDSAIQFTYFSVPF